MLTFELHPDETPNQRIARVASEAVSQGTMGRFLRGDRYASFLDIWDMSDDFSRLIDAMHSGAVLAGVKTSCAVDASSVLGYCGKKLHKPWRADGSWGITSWLGLGFDHPAWCVNGPKRGDNWRDLTPGDVVYRGKTTSPWGHVEIPVEKTESGLWVVVAGGGNLYPEDEKGLTAAQINATNGTVMRKGQPKDIFAKDSLGRLPAGWWRGDMIGVPTWEQILQTLHDENV